jgi:hypothetical protein
MMPEQNCIDESDRGDYALTMLCAEIANRYIKQKLSPASQLQPEVVKHWRGLSRREILAIVDTHFSQHRRLYTCGSGDGYFNLLDAAVRQAIEAKHPAIDREPKRQQRPQRRVVKIPTASGIDDLIVDDPGADRLADDRDKGPTTERVSVVGDYEDDGEPINVDDDGPGA